MRFETSDVFYGQTLKEALLRKVSERDKKNAKSRYGKKEIVRNKAYDAISRHGDTLELSENAKKP